MSRPEARPRRRARAAAALGCALLAPPALAQRQGEALRPPERSHCDQHLRDFDALPDAVVGGESAALEGLRWLQLGCTVQARERADRLLAANPRSFAAQALIGIVQHEAEGNLARALHHLRFGRKLFEERYGARPESDSPWFWHLQLLQGLIRVTGEMGLDAERVQLIETREELYEPRRPGDLGWPLVRLGQYQRARLVIDTAMHLEQDQQQQTARIARCVLEAELLDREASYEACAEAAEAHGRDPDGDPVLWTNAAEAALGLLRFGEAERDNLEATRRPREAFTNPWANLVQLYVAEGRLPEALEAMREMVAWRDAQPAYVLAQTRGMSDHAAAVLLLVSGREREAARIAKRAVDQPDRYGASSDDVRQREAASALLDQSVSNLRAERALEAASWRRRSGDLEERWRWLRYRLRAALASRRAAALLAEDRVLECTLRAYLVDSIVLPEWLQLELVSALGPGVAEVALERARARETLPAAGAYLDAFEVEIAAQVEDWPRVAAAAETALGGLPRAELLLRARVALRAAEAARALGQRARSEELFEEVLQADPGTLRRAGVALPVRFTGSAGLQHGFALRMLRSSPRFAEGESGFEIRFAGEGNLAEICLLGPTSAVHACARRERAPDEDARESAERLVSAFHEAAFAPRVDLTQQDLVSLDGSPAIGGGRNADRLRSVLSELRPGAPSDPGGEPAPSL